MADSSQNLAREILDHCGVRYSDAWADRIRALASEAAADMRQRAFDVAKRQDGFAYTRDEGLAHDNICEAIALLPTGSIPDGASEGRGGGLWRPISSAPKDGSKIILCGHGPGYWNAVGQWVAWAEEWRDSASARYTLVSPTHWQPLLPAPPPAEGG